MNRYFKLFACCLMTKGAERTTIADVQRNAIYFIPNILFHILSDHENKPIEEIKAYFNNEHDDTIDEYFEYLAENELGFFCDNPENFPAIDLTWDKPELITNAILDIEDKKKYDIYSALDQLQKLGCKNIEFRIYNNYNFEDLTNLIKDTEDSIFTYISILIKYHSSFTIEKFQHFLIEFQKIQSLVIYNAPEEICEEGIYFTTQKITPATCCGIISPKYFSNNLEMFSESQQHNSCLNRKLSIDISGNIKNCPSLKKSFGHADKTTFNDVIKTQDFQSLWHISKSQIDVCNVCEFRNICTDCRAFTNEKTSSLHPKPSKCSYNPYTTEWENNTITNATTTIEKPVFS